MRISIDVDSRERSDTAEPIAAIADKVLGTACPWQTVTLHTGDYVVRLDGQPLLRVERKTWQDLSGSCQSGHFFEQRQRLLQECQEVCMPSCPRLVSTLQTSGTFFRG